MGIIIHDVEQGEQKWHDLHIGVPSASNFGRIVTPNRAKSEGLELYAKQLALELHRKGLGRKFKGNWTTERGHELEPEACADYEMENQVHLVHVGFITDNLMRYGCSPDSLIGDDGGYEAKCKTDEVHLDMLMKYDIDGQTPAEYIPQIQGCLFITGRKWWDLHLYHPTMRSITIRQYPDLLYFKVLRSQLKAINARKRVILDFINNSK